MRHLVSFVIATLNEEEDIEGLLKSIRDQSYKDHEVIIVDGGSKDRTVEIARKYTKKVFVLPGLGVTKSKLHAIKRAKGDIIQFADADNVFDDRHYLEKIVGLFKKHGVDAVATKIMPAEPRRNIITQAQAAYRNLTWERKQTQPAFDVDPKNITFSAFRKVFLARLLDGYAGLIGNDDLYLARRTKEIGGKTVFDPSVYMGHKDPYSSGQIKRQALWYGRVINQEPAAHQLKKLGYLGLFLLLYPLSLLLLALSPVLLLLWQLAFFLPVLYLAAVSRDFTGSLFLIYCLNAYRAFWFYAGYLKGFGKVKKRAFWPTKKWLVLMLLLTAIDAGHFAAYHTNAQEGYQYIGLTTDEAIVLGLARSADMNYLNPWNVGSEENVFTTLALTSPFVYVPVGMLASVTGTDLFAVNFLIRLAAAFLFYLVAYHLIRAFFPDDKKFNIAYFLFALVTGASGLIYAAIAALGFSGDALRTVAHLFAYYEFEKLTYSVYYQLYYTLPKIAGMLSLLALLKGRKKASAGMLGLALLLYPAIGIAFAAGSAIYYAVLREKFIRNIVLTGVISGIIFSPWLIMQRLNPANFAQYAAEYRTVAFLPGVIACFLLMLPFIAYALYRDSRVFRSKPYLALLAVFAVLFSINQLREAATESGLVENWAISAGLMNIASFLSPYSLAIEGITMLLLLAGVVSIYRAKWDERKKFIFIWAIALIAFAIISQNYVPWGPHRFLFALRLPIAIAAAFGLMQLSERLKISHVKILAVLFIISVPTILGAEARAQTFSGGDASYYPTEDIEALRFLEGQEQGIVLSSPKIGTFGPAIAAKRFVLFGVPAKIVIANFDDKLDDYKEFYSSGNRRVLDKYNIKYVFYGPEEAKISDANLDELDFLEKIYDGGSKVYRVAGSR
jgi:glycosyltransferase involved in cell wall biosynthesis